LSLSNIGYIPHILEKYSNTIILIELIEFWIYSTDFVKNSNIRILIEFIEFGYIPQILEKYSNIRILMKIRPVGDKLFHADGGTDEQKYRLDKANNRLTKFCERG
jgi:hypothetical protein